MWYFWAIFLISTALALDPTERLKNVKILRTLPDNIILLDRGLEDGIYKNDHIKLAQEEGGYSARAICLRATSDNSFWKLYRIPFAETISRDLSYTIVGIADREIPAEQLALRDADQKFEDGEPQKKRDPGPNPFDVKQDLPEKLTERDLIDAVGPEKRKLFVERAINQDQLKRDLKDYRLSFYASPFTRQSINQGESFRYGVRGGNIASRYRLLTQFEQQQSRMQDPLTKESVSTRSTNAQAQFIIHRLTQNKSTLSILNFNSTRFSRLGTPKAHWQLGPLGFTWHLFENKNWEYLDLSYVPLFDMRTTDVINSNGTTADDKTTGIRHGFRGALRAKINERVSIENLLWVKPYQDPATWQISTDNLNLSNDLKMIFNLTENLYVDYNLIYQKDKLWKTLSRLPESNTINSVNFRYDMDL